MDWSRVFSITTQELDFSQLCRLYRFSKVVYHLKPKNHFYGSNILSKSVLLIFFWEHLGHAWLNPKNITRSNCNFHKHLTTLKKELYTSNNFCHIKTWKFLQSDWTGEFSYITWEKFSQNMLFLQNHKHN